MSADIDERDADARRPRQRRLASELARGAGFMESLRFINGLVEAIGGRITTRDIEVAKRIAEMRGARV
jgi:hypothetical protein